MEHHNQQHGISGLLHRILVPFYKFVARSIVRLIYRTEFIGFDQLPDAGPALLICNHLSYMDGLIIYSASKREVRFIIDKDVYEHPFVYYFLRHVQAIPILPKKEYVDRALKEVAKGLQNDDVICLFPEGRLTPNGKMQHFRPGIEWILKRNKVPVYPLALHGLWGSILSREGVGKWHQFIPTTLFRRVKAICGQPIPADKATVDLLQSKVYDLREKIRF